MYASTTLSRHHARTAPPANAFATELRLLASRSKNARDAICEWAHNPALYPTLGEWVRNGSTTIAEVTAAAADLGK